MDKNAQRIAIAEACGWKLPNGIYFGKLHISPDGSETGLEPPDYLNDLNAMHEAEKTLTASQEIGYRSQLQTVFADASGYSKELFGWYTATQKAYMATAAQRAEAFLKTLWLWKETPVKPLKECYAKDGAPICCFKCGSTKLRDVVKDRIDYTVCEFEIRCEACNTEVGYWAYGYYDWQFALTDEELEKGLNNETNAKT